VPQISDTHYHFSGEKANASSDFVMKNRLKSADWKLVFGFEVLL